VGCTRLMWVVDSASNAPSSFAGASFLRLPLSRHQNHTVHVRNIWEKVHRMWTAIYSTSLLLEFEWFLKADDDTFVSTTNLLGFLQYYDPTVPHYLGHSIRSRWERDNVIFNSGTCYVLSRASLQRVGRYLAHLPTVDPPPGFEICVDRAGAGEDPATASCLLGVGIRPGNTLDHELRERFLSFRDTDHVRMEREDTWYWKYTPHGMGQGANCCSPHLISMHNYKHTAEAKRLYPVLMEKYNAPKDWGTMLLPPRPRLVMWDRHEMNLTIDEFLNVRSPPKGQRIYQGEGKEWQCVDCKVGDPKDLYWTEWWDDVRGIQTASVHRDDPYSPLRASSEGR